jgi:hypothetical protein
MAAPPHPAASNDMNRSEANARKTALGRRVAHEDGAVARATE